MTTPSGLNKRFESFIEDIQREAYEKGWNDAANQILATARDMGTGKSAHKRVRIRERPAASTPRKRAKRGSVEKTIKRILRQAGNDGLTAGEIHEQAGGAGKKMAASSIRQKLPKLERAGKVVKSEEGRWLLAQHRLDVEQESAGNPAPALPHTSNGGSTMPP